jgi:hypothetical protein
VSNVAILSTTDFLYRGVDLRKLLTHPVCFCAQLIGRMCRLIRNWLNTRGVDFCLSLFRPNV